MRIVDWQPGSKSPVGELVERLGMAGNNDTEMHAILAEYELPYRFEPEVEAAAEAIDARITQKEIDSRRDFRDYGKVSARHYGKSEHWHLHAQNFPRRVLIAKTVELDVFFPLFQVEHKVDVLAVQNGAYAVHTAHVYYAYTAHFHIKFGLFGCGAEQFVRNALDYDGVVRHKAMSAVD